VIVGFSGEDLKLLAHVTVRLQVSDYRQPSDFTVQLQLCRWIRAKYTSLCTNHIWGNCNCYEFKASWKHVGSCRVLDKLWYQWEIPTYQFPMLPPNHHKFSINLSGLVADLVGFLTWDPLLIWNNVRVPTAFFFHPNSPSCFFNLIGILYMFYIS